ncbi:MAG: CHAD domain-containing protein [Acidobacteria bacterium]|nr:CHAD domain-containing protein [Acidobacteriota bacterium]
MTFVPEISCADDALEAAGKILRGRISQIFDLREAVIESEDIEAVHDMRVATRRMRSALRDLKPFADPESLRKLVDNLKSLANTLGTARDLDVAIVGLRSLNEKSDDPAIRHGIEQMIADRVHRREEIQPTLVECVSEVSLTNLLLSFNGVFLDPAEKPCRASFEKAGRRAIERAIREFNGLSDSLYKPTQVDRLHQLRIAAKRLRYAIEFFGVCWGKKLKRFAKEVAEMQTFLGELHDADVWIEKLDREPHDELNRWLFLEHFKARTGYHRSAFELWRNWQRKGFITRLEKLIGN